MTVKDALLKKIVFVQIGACNADDYFADMVKAFTPSLAVVVEPSPECMGNIVRCYKDYPNVIIENVAITKEDIDYVELSIPDNNNDYCIANYSLVPRSEWGEVNTRKTFVTKGVNIMSLFKKYNISHVDLLYIDAEGYDAEIIQSIDFKRVTINVICFEYWHYPPEEFSKYNKDYIQLGSAGLDRALIY
jgi:FkbM family methyltransferase